MNVSEAKSRLEELKKRSLKLERAIALKRFLDSNMFSTHRKDRDRLVIGVGDNIWTRDPQGMELLRLWDVSEECLNAIEQALKSELEACISGCGIGLDVSQGKDSETIALATVLNHVKKESNDDSANETARPRGVDCPNIKAAQSIVRKIVKERVCLNSGPEEEPRPIQTVQTAGRPVWSVEEWKTNGVVVGYLFKKIAGEPVHQTYIAEESLGAALRLFRKQNDGSSLFDLSAVE